MSVGWLRQRERGSAVFIGCCAWLGNRIGWHAGRVLQFPICAYFWATSRRVRGASRVYRAAALGRRVGWRDVFRHCLTFSHTIHDRIFFLSGRFSGYQFTITGEEILLDVERRKTGCVLLGSHLGSFEAIRSYGLIDRDLPIKVLMYPENSRRFSAVQNKLNRDVADSIIPLGATKSLIEVKEHVERGGMIGILGDRSINDERTVRAPFFGREAAFPAGPLLLANALDVPVVLFFALYRGGRHYEIHFELLSERLDIARATRERDLQSWAARYAARLEHYCRRAPYNWFNFFDFWDSHAA